MTSVYNIFAKHLSGQIKLKFKGLMWNGLLLEILKWVTYRTIRFWLNGFRCQSKLYENLSYLQNFKEYNNIYIFFFYPEC